MKHWIAAVFLATCLSGCASSRGAYHGEHLVIPFIEELKQWQLFQKEDEGFRSNMWQQPGEKWKDTYAVSIYTVEQPDSNEKNQFINNSQLEHKRQTMDAPGQQYCHHFDSQQLEHPKQADMQMLYWRTQCQVEGAVVAEMLHLMIQGNQSFYQIQKIWKFDVDELEFNLWKSRFDNTFICHQGKQASTCPKSDN
jgi:hypothetical protein